MNFNKRRLFIMTITFLLIVLVACSSKTSNDPTPGQENSSNETSNNSEKLNNKESIQAQFSLDEVTINVATPWGEDGFNGHVGDYIREKLPHITIEHVDWDGTAGDLEELYANEITPDVFLAFTGQQPLEKLDSVYPLDDMIENYGIDLSHIQDVALNEIRSRDKDQRLVGIPFESTFYGLYYNKDIFDTFGEEYPSPDGGMTWDQVMDLASKFNTERNNVKYCGLDMTGLEDTPLSQLSVNKSDPETGEVLLTKKPEFTKYLELMDRYYSMPGNHDEDCSFYEDTTAMALAWQGGGFDFDDPESLEHIDVSPLPVWSELPGVDPVPSGHPWTINAFSENKDAALQYILEATSDEFWTVLAKSGTPAPSSTGIPNQEYGSEHEHMQGKNIEAFFVNTPATPPERRSAWDSYVEFDFEELSKSGIDIQEFLRETEEKSEIKIEEARANK